MSTSSNNKSINKNPLHESNQIKNVTLHIANMLHDDGSGDNIKNLQLLNQIYISAPTKLKSVFGNNLAQTKIGKFLVTLLESYNNEDPLPPDQRLLSVTLCLCCLWNATDYGSENMGVALVNLDKFRVVISGTFKKLDLFNDTEKSLSYSIISVIIHNIVRRPRLVDSFKGYGVEAQVVQLAKCCEETEIELKEHYNLYSSINESVVCFLDGASNSEDYRSEGFSGKELLDVIKSLSRIDHLKRYFVNSNTLRATFIRFLSQNHQIALVIDVVKTIYNEQDIQSLLEIYKSKNKVHNHDVLKGFAKEK